jgi:flagellar hook-associated protein 3 FlgL
MIVNTTMFPVPRGYSAIAEMNRMLETLQQQLATGKRAASLGEMGTGRIVDLTLRSRLGAMEGYGQTMQTVGLRLELMSQAMNRIDALEAETRADVQVGSRDVNGTNLPTAQFLAKNRLSELIDLLNTQVNGRFLFAGANTEQRPVALFDELMNGSGGRAGFRQVMAERLAADQGASGLGRVTTGLAGTTVSLTEDGVHPFGFKLDSVSATGSAVTLTAPAGSPASLSVDFTAQPAAGDTVLIGVGLPDGSTRTLTLTATAGAPAKPGEFQIGATQTDTAANFEAALTALLTDKAGTELQAASAFAAANMFFAAKGETPMRVDGPPYDSATGLVAATSADTVMWYQGEDASDPRGTVTAKIDDSSTVAYGVQANEAGTTTLMRSLAVLASDSVSSTDANAREFYAAANSRAAKGLSEDNNSKPGSIETVVMDIALAQTAIGRAQERQDQHKVTLEGMLSDIEDVPPEEVAMKLVALQTRLQASYQTMSIVSRLSLVNYLNW